MKSRNSDFLIFSGRTRGESYATEEVDVLCILYKEGCLKGTHLPCPVPQMSISLLHEP